MKLIKMSLVSFALLFMILGCTENVKDVVEDNGSTEPVSVDDSSASSNNTSSTPVITTDGTEEGSPAVNYSRVEDINKPVDDEEEEPIVAEEKPSNWYIRLVAEDSNRGLKTNIAQLGVVEEDADKYTLLSTGHFGGTYLDIVFINPADISSGIYKTLYHLYQEGNTYRWQFTVRNDDTTADIALSWNGLFALTPYVDGQNRTQYREYRSMTNPLVRQMKLVDVDLGTEIAVSVDGHVKPYIFNMDGKTERVFEWVVETDIVNIAPKQIEKSFVKSKSLKINVLKNPKSNVIDFSKPPIMEWDNEK